MNGYMQEFGIGVCRFVSYTLATKTNPRGVQNPNPKGMLFSNQYQGRLDSNGGMSKSMPHQIHWCKQFLSQQDSRNPFLCQNPTSHQPGACNHHHP